MDSIKVDFSAVTGKIKPAHSVNNGPISVVFQPRIKLHNHTVMLIQLEKA